MRGFYLSGRRRGLRVDLFPRDWRVGRYRFKYIYDDSSTVPVRIEHTKDRDDDIVLVRTHLGPFMFVSPKEGLGNMPTSNSPRLRLTAIR